MAEAKSPSRGFSRQLEVNAMVARDSTILDSRLEHQCFKAGRDSVRARAALEEGRSLSFVTWRSGRRITVHKIHPEEFL